MEIGELLKATFDSIVHWATGGGMYHTLTICMMNDWFWIGALTAGSLAVAFSYLAVATLAHKEYRKRTPKSAEGKLIMDFANVFVLCSLCGYMFYVVKVWFPIYRLLTLAVWLLAIVSWRFYFRAKKVNFFGKVISKAEKGHMTRLKEIEAELNAARQGIMEMEKEDE